MTRSLIIVTLLAFMLPSAPALAHAMLDHASPPVGSSVPKAPHEIVLWFTQDLEPTFSSIEVRNTSGAVVSNGRARGSGTQLKVSLKPLPPGTYQVIWRVLSVDTHRTQGNFSFGVGQ